MLLGGVVFFALSTYTQEPRFGLLKCVTCSKEYDLLKKTWSDLQNTLKDSLKKSLPCTTKWYQKTLVTQKILAVQIPSQQDLPIWKGPNVNLKCTPPKSYISPWKIVVGRWNYFEKWFPFWGDEFVKIFGELDSESLRMERISLQATGHPSKLLQYPTSAQ